MARQKLLFKRRYENKGVPKGYRERWKYKGIWNERKLRKGLWKFRFRAYKNRPARSWGSFGKGTYGMWYIKGYQKIRKVGKGKYLTDFRGYKKPVYFVVKKPKRGYY